MQKFKLISIQKKERLSQKIKMKNTEKREFKEPKKWKNAIEKS